MLGINSETRKDSNSKGGVTENGEGMKEGSEEKG